MSYDPDPKDKGQERMVDPMAEDTPTFVPNGMSAFHQKIIPIMILSAAETFA